MRISKGDRARFGRPALLVVAMLVALTPMQALAQIAGDAGVSGIPRGPGSVGGLNNSINDPSGIGNAGRIQAPPPPSTAVPAVPSASGPVSSSRLSLRSAPIVRATRERRASTSRRRSRRSSRFAVRARDKSFDRKVISICKGC